VNTDKLAAYLDQLLKVTEMPDYPRAFNGLQVANSGAVSRVAVAVDASEQAIRAAADLEANLLVVHHGLFWDPPGLIQGRRYRRLKLLFDNDIAVYSSHLPLDVHEDLGNNALLARELGIARRGSFGEYQGVPIGLWGELNVTRETLAARLDDVLGGRVRLIAGGPEILRRVGVVTGGAASMIGAAVAHQLDAFVTGEGEHHTYFDAMENGINVYYGGHYATEIFGVRALGAHISEKFDVPWNFIDVPTGL
jgi:dinuclear metal center YbgI/SA1388 family protein